MPKILVYPNKILRKEAKLVVSLDAATKKEIKKLIVELEKGENAAGLAAPQLGISKRFFGIKKSDKKVELFVNPEKEMTW